jgi:hypothetical protein
LKKVLDFKEIIFLLLILTADKSLQNFKKGFNAINRELQLIKSDDLEMPSNEFIKFLISIIFIHISGRN